MKKILFPTDFSKAAKNGFQYAVALAADIGATLDVMNVYTVPFTAIEDAPPDYFERLIEEQHRISEEKLEDFVKGIDADFKGERISVFGAFIPEEIIGQVKKNAYDLVVMGTKGERNALEKLVGSITTRTTMNAPCPVLAVPTNAQYKPIKKIAYASDFKPTDAVALQQLMTFTGQVGAKISFVHVDTMPDIGEIKDTISLKNYPFEFTDFSIINSASVTEGIDGYIEENNVDMLALFIPKRRLWERLFHNSFSKKYTFHTHVPLLVFHQ